LEDEGDRVFAEEVLTFEEADVAVGGEIDDVGAVPEARGRGDAVGGRVGQSGGEDAGADGVFEGDESDLEVGGVFDFLGRRRGRWGTPRPNQATTLGSGRRAGRRQGRGVDR